MLPSAGLQPPPPGSLLWLLQPSLAHNTHLIPPLHPAPPLIICSFLNALSLCHCPHALAGLHLHSFIHSSKLIEFHVCYGPDPGLGPGAMEVKETNAFRLWGSMTPGQRMEGGCPRVPWSLRLESRVGGLTGGVFT